METSLGLQVGDAVILPAENGIARVILSNQSGFTQVAGERDELGASK